MTPTPQLAMLAATNGAVASDNLTRQLDATDASIYQIEPAAVAFPREGRQASAIIRAPVATGAKKLRGGGTSGCCPGTQTGGIPVGRGKNRPRLFYHESTSKSG